MSAAALKLRAESAPALSQSMSLALEPDVSSSLFSRSRGRQVAGRTTNTTDIALVPDALWREAERRAAVIRPLAKALLEPAR